MQPLDEHALLQDLDTRFRSIAGRDNSIGEDRFKRVFEIRDDYYASRLFSIIDSDSSGQVDRDEFINFAMMVVRGGEEERLLFAFQLHDADGSGHLDAGELRQMLNACLEEHGVDLGTATVQRLAEMLVHDADQDGDGEISFSEFKLLFDRHPRLKRRMTSSVVTWLSARQAEPSRPGAVARLRSWFKLIRQNYQSAVFLILYAIINGGLFGMAVRDYADTNMFVQIARGAGACINFNGALILLPVMRSLLTHLRRTPVGRILPIDLSIDFHKMVGHVICALAVLHTAAHVVNHVAHTNESLTSWLGGTVVGITGVVALLVSTTMWFCSQDSLRRRGAFEMFFYTHLLFVVWFIIMLLHAPDFWKWVVLPGLLFLVEILLRNRKYIRHVPVQALHALPSGVTRVRLDRPAHFKFRAGDYLFVQIPVIARYEWHPFTITSAPHETEALEIHVRSLGNWTTKLYRRATEEADHSAQAPITACLDGPFGTPSSEIFTRQNVVLIGAGIGVTPFAAILKSLFAQRRMHGADATPVKRVHFLWLNRDHESFEWFSKMLIQLEDEDTEGILNIGIFITGIKVDARSSTLDVALDLYRTQTKRDLITGLHAPTRFGRPDWAEYFQEIADVHQSEPVDVFFCGPPRLGMKLRLQAQVHGFSFRREIF